MAVEDDDNPELTAKVAEMLWDDLKRDVGHPDRRRTGHGTKTKLGLRRSVERLVIESGQKQADKTELYIDGVRADKIEMSRSPAEHEPTEDAAKRVINALDNAGYSREQVHAIIKWALYLSTQA